MKKLLKSYKTIALVKFTKAYDIFGDIINYILINDKIKINNCNLFTKFELNCNKEKFINCLPVFFFIVI